MYDVTAAPIVRYVREHAGMSQRTLAEKAATTQAAIARIESGDTNPSVETLARVVTAAGFELQLKVVARRTADPVVDAYKPGVDQTLCVENLRRTPEKRLQPLADLTEFGLSADRAANRRPRQSADVPTLLKALIGARVDFVVVGGCAAVLQGSARYTDDLDIVYDRTEENIAALRRALAPLKPWPRGAIAELPYAWTEATIKRGLNISLATSAGAIDLIGDLTGCGLYDDAHRASDAMRLFRRNVRVLSVDALIRTKRAAGRWQDFHAIAELELLQDLGRNGTP